MNSCIIGYYFLSIFLFIHHIHSVSNSLRRTTMRHRTQCPIRASIRASVSTKVWPLFMKALALHLQPRRGTKQTRWWPLWVQGTAMAAVLQSTPYSTCLHVAKICNVPSMACINQLSSARTWWVPAFSFMQYLVPYNWIILSVDLLWFNMICSPSLLTILRNSKKRVFFQ